MSPEVVRSKLGLLHEVLRDLKPHIIAERAVQEKAHYEIERQVQLAVDLSATIARRILMLKGMPVPETSREVFLALVKARVISPVIGGELAKTVGLRNLIVHEYGIIDYSLFFGGLRNGYKAFVNFANKVAQQLKKPDLHI